MSDLKTSNWNPKVCFRARFPEEAMPYVQDIVTLYQQRLVGRTFSESSDQWVDLAETLPQAKCVYIRAMNWHGIAFFLDFAWNVMYDPLPQNVKLSPLWKRPTGN